MQWVFGRRETFPVLWVTLLMGLTQACSCEDRSLLQIDGTLEIEPNPLDLGAVSIGLEARSMLVFKNFGNAPLELAEVRFDEALGPEFSFGPTPEILSAGAATVIEVRFVPTSPGPREGEIIAMTDSFEDPEVRTRVVALATDPKLAADPPVVDFGRVVLGQSATENVVVRNTGDVTITVRSLLRDTGTSEEFETELESATPLAPGGELSLTLGYRPTNLGLDEGRIVVGDDTGLGNRLGIFVRGQGVESEIEIDPLEIEFTGLLVGDERTREIEIRNIGARPHTISTVALTSGSSPDFEVTDAGAPFDLAPGEERRVEVKYTASDTAPDQGLVTVESTGLNTPAFVRLTGTAAPLAIPNIEVTPRSIAFGAAQVGTSSPRSLRITNTGTGDLRLSGSLEIQPAGGPYGLVNPPPPDAVFAPLDTHLLGVEFTPTRTGPAPAGSVTIRSDDPDEGVIVVPLGGEGQEAGAPAIEVTPNPVVFGQVPRGTVAGRSLKIRNVGSAPLVVSQVTLPQTAGNRFRLASLPSLPQSLLPSQDVQLSVEFEDPAGFQAPHGGMLRIASNDPRSPIDVPLQAETIPPPATELDIAVQLSWDTDQSDVDMHLVRPGGAYFDTPSDCCWCNPNPDWGLSGQPQDNPFLDRDDINGFGPENVNLQDAGTGEYRLLVHYYSDHAAGPTTAQVVLRSQGNILGSYSKFLSNNDLWTVGSFQVNAAAGTVSFTPSTAFVLPSSGVACF